MTWHWDPSQPRVESGPTGGQWTAGPQTSDEEAAASGDEEAKRLFRQMLNMNPDQQAKFLAGLSKDQLGRLGKFANLGSGDPQINQIRDSIGKSLEGRGMDPAQYGFKPKKGKAEKKGGSGKSGGGSKGGGGKSSGGKKSSGGGGKSSGGSSSGKKSSGSSSGSKKTSSSSSNSKKTDDSAKTSKTAKGNQAAPPPPPVRVTPARGRTPGGKSGTPRITPPGQPRPQPVRAAGTAASGHSGAVRIVGPRTAEAPTNEENA